MTTVSAEERIRLGIDDPSVGQSTTDDQRPGGSVYLLTRIKPCGQWAAYGDLVFDVDLVRSTQVVVYAFDNYGRSGTPNKQVRHQGNPSV